MKVQVDIMGIQQSFEAADPAALLHVAKQEAAKRAPFLLRAVVNGMSDIKFAQEAVKRANAASGASDPPPQSAEDFLAWARQRGYATVVED